MNLDELTNFPPCVQSWRTRKRHISVELHVPINSWSCIVAVLFNFFVFIDLFSTLCFVQVFFPTAEKLQIQCYHEQCADSVFLSTLGHLFTLSSLEADLSHCNCFSLACYSVSIMASSRGTTWFTALNIQTIGAPTSDLHQVITAAGFPRSNLQAICKHFELCPNLQWTCESNLLWWKSA